MNVCFFLVNFFSFDTGVWTQGLHLDPLHQPFFCDGFFWDRVSRTICLGWLQTTILLIPASWVARITGMSYQHQAIVNSFVTRLHASYELRVETKKKKFFFLNRLFPLESYLFPLYPQFLATINLFLSLSLCLSLFLSTHCNAGWPWTLDPPTCHLMGSPWSHPPRHFLLLHFSP
jgi:hypothetical protein